MSASRERGYIAPNAQAESANPPVKLMPQRVSLQPIFPSLRQTASPDLQESVFLVSLQRVVLISSSAQPISPSLLPKVLPGRRVLTRLFSSVSWHLLRAF